MKTKKLWVIPIMLCCLCACSKKAKIQGEITGMGTQRTVLYKVFPQEKVIEDTVLFIKGKCSFTVPQESIGVYILQFEDTSFVSFIVQKGDMVTFSADISNINRTLQMEGNEETMLHWQCRKALFAFEDKVKNLSRQFISQHQYADADVYDLNQVMLHKYDSLYEEHRAYLENFIRNNPDKLAALLAFYQGLGRRTFFNSQTDRDLLELIYQHLQPVYPQSEYILDLKERLGYDD